MATTRRQKRIGELLKEELGILLLREARDPRLAGVTVIDVEVSPDLGHAQVYVSLIGSQEEKNEALKALEHASGFLKHELADHLELRRVPALTFRLDDSIERGQRILDILYQLEQTGAHPLNENEEA